MKVDLKPLLVVAVAAAAIVVLTRLVRVVLLRLTGTVVRNERHGDRPVSPKW